MKYYEVRYGTRFTKVRENHCTLFWILKFSNLFKQKDFLSKVQQNRNEMKTWRNKSKKLLYSMLPYSIAAQIEQGIQPNTICKVK